MFRAVFQKNQNALKGLLSALLGIAKKDIKEVTILNPITYLGRAFDQTKSGGDYSDITTTIHIGILDFNLKHLTPEFYSEFRLMNVKNHEIYSDKLVLRVLNCDYSEPSRMIRKRAMNACIQEHVF